MSIVWRALLAIFPLLFDCLLNLSLFAAGLILLLCIVCGPIIICRIGRGVLAGGTVPGTIEGFYNSLRENTNPQPDQTAPTKPQQMPPTSNLSMAQQQADMARKIESAKTPLSPPAPWSDLTAHQWHDLLLQTTAQNHMWPPRPPKSFLPPREPLPQYRAPPSSFNTWREGPFGGPPRRINPRGHGNRDRGAQLVAERAQQLIHANEQRRQQALQGEDHERQLMAAQEYRRQQAIQEEHQRQIMAAEEQRRQRAIQDECQRQAIAAEEAYRHRQAMAEQRAIARRETVQAVNRFKARVHLAHAGQETRAKVVFANVNVAAAPPPPPPPPPQRPFDNRPPPPLLPTPPSVALSGPAPPAPEGLVGGLNDIDQFTDDVLEEAINQFIADDVRAEQAKRNATKAQRWTQGPARSRATLQPRSRVAAPMQPRQDPNAVLQARQAEEVREAQRRLEEAQAMLAQARDEVEQAETEAAAELDRQEAEFEEL